MFRLNSTLIGVAIASMVIITGSTMSPCPVQAQGGGCVANCRAAYADCYRSTSNRAACEGQLQRCLQGCIASKRS